MPQFNFSDNLFWLAFAAFVGYFLFGIIRRGGLKAGLFNARVGETLGEIEAVVPKLMSQKLKVHSLNRDGTALVGIEVVSKTFASYQMLPVVLSAESAKELSVLLERAAKEARDAAT